MPNYQICATTWILLTRDGKRNITDHETQHWINRCLEFLYSTDFDGVLDLSHCGPRLAYTLLSAITKQLDQATCLKVRSIKLSHNRLQSLPFLIRRFQGLEVIDLSHNHLRHIPAGLLHCTRLFQINLSHNLLTQVHPAIAKLQRLHFLYLDHNQLQQLPDSMRHLHQLITLSVGHNGFSNIPSVCHRIRHLEGLSIDPKSMLYALWRDHHSTQLPWVRYIYLHVAIPNHKWNALLQRSMAWEPQTVRKMHLWRDGAHQVLIKQPCFHFHASDLLQIMYSHPKLGREHLKLAAIKQLLPLPEVIQPLVLAYCAKHWYPLLNCLSHTLTQVEKTQIATLAQLSIPKHRGPPQHMTSVAPMPPPLLFEVKQAKTLATLLRNFTAPTWPTLAPKTTPPNHPRLT